METNMKIDVEESIVYKFDNKEDLSQAVLVLGEKGYFSDTEDFITYEYGILSEVKCWVEGCKNPFLRSCEEEEESNCYRYFIPEDAVAFKEEEPKKLRPFKNIYEFKRITSCAIGNVIIYKKKDCDAEYTVLLNGYVLMNGNALGIYLGRRSYTLEELSNDYLYYDNGKWHPFGVEE